MKFCGHCGTPMDDTNLFCPSCGREQGGAGNGYYNESPIWQAVDDNMPHPSITVISFIFPIFSLILFSLWRYSQPSKARAAAKGGFFGVSFSYPIVGLVLYLVFKDSRHDTARGCGISAIIGACFAFVVSILLIVLSSVLGISFDISETAAYALPFLR